MLDAQLSDAENQIKDLEILLDSARREWEEKYPYEALEFALEAIKRLGEKLLDLDPEDLEAQEIMAQAVDVITPKLEEPDVFYLD